MSAILLVHQRSWLITAATDIYREEVATEDLNQQPHLFPFRRVDETKHTRTQYVYDTTHTHTHTLNSIPSLVALEKQNCPSYPSVDKPGLETL